MHNNPLFPLRDEAERLEWLCKLPLHYGKAKIGGQLDFATTGPLAKLLEDLNKDAPSACEVEFDAAFLVPAAGECLVFLQVRPDVRLGCTFGHDLVVTGESQEGPFKLHCPQFYIRSEGEGPDDRRWAIAEPVNKTAEIAYGDPRPIRRVSALVNNFAFDNGNEPKGAGKRTILRVSAGGILVDFVRRVDYQQVKTLLKLGVLGPTSLTSLCFDAWEHATEEELGEFAFDVAGLCGIVARQHTGIPILSFLDANGQPIKRRLVRPVTSSFRGNYIVRNLQLDRGLPTLFQQCFENYRRMRKSKLWSTIPSFCQSIEDSPYLEQKCAMAMAAVERLLRNSLVEANHCSVVEAEKMMLIKLIGAAKAKLTWDIPKHYTANDRARELRNAVAHGGPLPQSPKLVRHEMDKWSLFLMRRVLMQLGYDGHVSSPDAGFLSETPVNDFSENANSFVT